MKKSYLIASALVIVVTIIFVVKSLNNDEKNISSQAMEVMLRKIQNFEKAEVVKTNLDEMSASIFPGTLIFVLKDENYGLMVLNSLPRLYAEYDTIYSCMHHGNVTLLESNSKGVTAVMPKHMFDDDIDLISILKEQGFNPSSKGDLVTINFKRMQNSLACKMLDKLDPKQLDGASCELKTLNCFNYDKNLYQYKFNGTIHYLSVEEQKMIVRDAVNSFGEKAQTAPTKGLYVISVPNALFNDIPGMSGGSVVVKLKGEDYFLGINTHRLVVGYMDGKDTIINTLVVVQPVLSSDI